MLDASYYRKTDEIISRYVRDARSLIPIMQDIQAEYRYLPPELLSYVAKEIGITEAKAYSVATFYENFSFEAKGKYVIKVCDGTACHIKGSVQIQQWISDALGIKPGETDSDGIFSLETVACLGCCSLAPVMSVNGKVHAKLDRRTMMKILKEYAAK